MDKYVLAGLFVLATLAVAVYIGKSDPIVVTDPNVGAIPGNEVFGPFTVYGAFSQGGGVTTIDPIDATLSLTAGQMQNANVITFPASTTQPALTVTLPASTTFPLPKDAGSYRTWVIENPFTAAATTTTIAATTGVDLQEPDGQNVVIGINNYAFVTCFREKSSDVVCEVDESIPAD